MLFIPLPTAQTLPTFMKRRLPATLALLLCAAAVPSCTNAEGRFRPPDPLGRLIFDALDPGPRHSDADYVNEPSPQYTATPQGSYSTNEVWVEGAYARDAYGRRVWVPAHWAPVSSR